MDITISNTETYLKLGIVGDLDASSSMKLDKVLADALKDNAQNIIIDCKDLNYISSAGLGVFMSYIQDFKDNNVTFGLYNLSEKVRNVFSMLGLEKLISIFNNESDAIANI